jgi:alginate O-acetyltransferase complex protein AlgI
MLFNSFPFLLAFLPLVVLSAIVARSLWGPKASQFVILLASLVFYGWFKPSNLWYLAASILGNFLLAQRIAAAEQPRRKQLLITGLVLNIGYLCTFKYVNFLAANIPFLSLANLHLPNLAFPLGISFFTLLQVMYLVDCYEGLLPALNLFDHATFVAFFPYVISGPIARAKRMTHQFGNFGGEPGTRSALIARGLYQFSIGLFKKVIFADAFASIANLGFGTGGRLTALEAWAFSLAYTFQIYFDFSGYSDMAIGAGMMLGVEIPRNFDAPFRSKSIIEFWQRWHITLSNFITTYLYTPILKSFPKATLVTASLATLCAMAIAGLWHGPSWNFVLFGFLHGSALVINQYWRKKKLPKLPALASWLITFLFVNFAFIFFRSETIHGGTQMALSLVNLASHPLGHEVFDAARGTFTGRLGLAIAIGSVLAFFGKASDQLAREFEPTYWSSFGVATAVVVCCLSLVFNTTQSFVYFKF